METNLIEVMVADKGTKLPCKLSIVMPGSMVLRGMCKHVSGNFFVIEHMHQGHEVHDSGGDYYFDARNVVSVRRAPA